MLSLPLKPKSTSHWDDPDGIMPGFRIPLNVGIESVAPETSLKSDELIGVDMSTPAIRRQVAHILKSRVFVQSERLSRFLRFIVDHVLEGNQDFLKEYVIGSEVYDRKPPYHPNQDSIVRTEARRLRSKLKEYYETDGKEAPVYVYLRPGSYVPVFQYRDSLAGIEVKAVIDGHSALARSSVIAIAILPFSDISANLISSTYARAIPDELSYILTRTEGCKVVSRFSVTQTGPPEQDVAGVLRRIGADIAFEGSVRAEGSHIRVTASIVGAAGFQLWTKRVDADANLHSRFVIEEQIASVLSSGLVTLFGACPCRNIA